MEFDDTVLEPNPVRRRETEHPIAGMGKSVVGIDPHGDAYIVDTSSGISMQGPTAYEWAKKAGLEARMPRGTYVPRTHGNPSGKLREKWGANTTIVIERGTHGYSGWLESKTGGRAPISFGARTPETAREALELAKKFLRGVHGRSNPAFKVGDRVTNGDEEGSVTEVGEYGLVYVQWDSDKGRKDTAVWKHTKRTDSQEPSESLQSIKSNPEDTFDTDILGGMESAIWVTSYADWADEQEGEDLGPGPGGNWEDVTPAAPGSAEFAAADLCILIERVNDKTLGELFAIAMQADSKRPTDERADMFGHYLAMQAMGHGVSWFDDHKRFPLKMPRGFEAHTFDGEEVTWSPMVRSTQNPNRRSR